MDHCEREIWKREREALIQPVKCHQGLLNFSHEADKTKVRTGGNISAISLLHVLAHVRNHMSRTFIFSNI